MVFACRKEGVETKVLLNSQCGSFGLVTIGEAIVIDKKRIQIF